MGATTASGSLRQRIVSHPAPSGAEVRSPPAAIGLPEVRLSSDCHLVNPKISLRVSVLSCRSVCCEVLRLAPLVLWQDSLNHFL